MKLIFTLLLSILSGCDPIYTFKSKYFSIDATTAIEQCIRIEGINSVFPGLRNIYIKSETAINDSNLLIVLFNKNSDLLSFKEFVNNSNNKSIAFLKSKIQNKDVNGFLLANKTVLPNTVAVDNISIFKEGLWVVFIDDSISGLLEVAIELKRIGINEFPVISVEQIK